MPSANVRRRGVGIPDLRDGQLRLPLKNCKSRTYKLSTNHGADRSPAVIRDSPATPARRPYSIRNSRP